MRVIKLFAVFVVVTAVAAAVAQADVAGPPWGPATPNFNLEVILHPAAVGPGGSFGLVKFRQPKDANTIVNLGVWVRDLAPNHSYSLQRATDSNVNGDCTGANWAMPTLGQVATDETGTGRADLFRNLAAIPLGTQLDIHFRVIDAVTSAVVLESGCYQFTVSQ